MSNSALHNSQTVQNSSAKCRLKSTNLHRTQRFKLTTWNTDTGETCTKPDTLQHNVTRFQKQYTAKTLSIMPSADASGWKHVSTGTIWNLECSAIIIVGCFSLQTATLPMGNFICLKVKHSQLSPRTSTFTYLYSTPLETELFVIWLHYHLMFNNNNRDNVSLSWRWRRRWHATNTDIRASSMQLLMTVVCLHCTPNVWSQPSLSVDDVDSQHYSRSW